MSTLLESTTRTPTSTHDSNITHESNSHTSWNLPFQAADERVAALERRVACLLGSADALAACTATELESLEQVTQYSSGCCLMFWMLVCLRTLSAKLLQPLSCCDAWQVAWL